MQEKDISSITYFEKNVRIADLLNGFLFDGEQYLRSEDIQEKNRTDSVTKKKGNKKKSWTISRDIVRQVSMQMRVVLVALENQSEVHYAMSVPVIMGDGIQYHKQWREIAAAHAENKDLSEKEFLSGISQEEKLMPVITIVIYLGENEWDGPRCLKDMLDLESLPPSVQKLVNDYPIHILELRKFEHYERFQTDLRLVFGFWQRTQDDEKLEAYVKENQQAFSNLSEDAFDFIGEFAYVRQLKMMKKVCESKATGGYDMCKAIDDMIRKGEKRGEVRGEERGIEALVETLQELGISIEQTASKVKEKFMLEDDKVTFYLEKFWSKI